MKNFNQLSHLKLWTAVLITVLLANAGYSQTLSGTAFFDGNNNGVKEASETGFPFVSVKAYNASNTAVATATSLDTPAADIGKYTLSGLTAGTKYRLEFTLPSGYNDGAFSATSNSSVQFATAGATNLDFGVYVPGKSLPDKNLRMVAGCANNQQTSMTTSMVSWDYNSDVPTLARYQSTPHTDDVNSSVTGTPFALAAQKIKGAVRVLLTTISSPNTAVTPVSPDGANAIYMADYSGANNTYLGIKLLTKLSALTPSINSTNQNPVGSVTNIGEYGLGGIAVSEDNKTMYVINMGNGKIVKVDISTADYATIPAGGYTNLPVSEITIPTAISACVGGIFRPSIVKYHAGSVYVAGVCDASTSSTVSNSDLRLKVLKINPSDNSFTLVMDADLSSFRAGSLGSNAGSGPNPGWKQTQWKDAFVGAYGLSNGEVQPMVTDIGFDDTGSLLIGVANRKLFEAGNANPAEMGYVVRTWRKADGTFELENAGVSGPFTSTARINNLTPVDASINATDFPNNYDNDNRGPGLKYFFEQAIVVGGPNDGHPYLYDGGIFIAPGTGEALVGFTDPMALAQSGARYFDWKTGVTKSGTSVTGFKIFSITGVEGVSEPAPIEIGNRVWDDTDADGIQDPTETGIAGIKVDLCLASAPTTVVATATTDANGNYIFSSATGTTTTALIYALNLSYSTDYILKFPTTSGAKTLTVTTGGNDLTDSDADATGKVVLTMGTSGQNNHSYDVGYKGNVCTKPIAKINSQSMCEGDTPKAFTATPTTGVTYAWYGPLNDTTSTLGTAVGGQTLATYTPTGALAVGKKYYAVITKNASDVTCSDTAFAALTVLAKPAIIKICQGETYTITAEAGTANIKWYKDGVVVTDSTRSSFIVKTIGSYTYSGIKAGGDLCQDTLCCPFIFEACLCPTIAQPADTTICAGSTITLRADLTGITTQDIKFVYFNTHQTVGSTIYGTPDGVLGTVTNAQLTASKTKAALNVTIPATPASKTYHVYAILSPTPADVACRPFGHRHVITDPTKCAPVPCGLPDCLGVAIKKN